MWPLPRPPYKAYDFYQASVLSTRSKEVSDRLLGLSNNILQAAERYKPAASNGALHQLKDLAGQPSDAAGKSALLWAYEQGIVRNKKGRLLYDFLLAQAPYGRCPFCWHRNVHTIDHQLPKSSYPLLSIIPDNLVPACTNCNHRKNDTVAASTQTQILHPYFEHADHGRWLFARVAYLEPVTVLFSADPDPTFSETMQTRIRHQFTQFRLASLYGQQAASQIAGERHRIDQLRQQAGPTVLSAHLRDAADSWAKQSVNCWQRAMYEALATHSGFLESGT
ncbi:hypothetical protein FHX34_103952 [Actinoplanes teichomyceticus]|uniref:HNH endonuclease n=2 Tax=Actinoplanes teichomyceticus TaxID=1867 RepID=A0A561WC23_ACTTI|nr:hypothetical protein FHX34_103952 [Actinoplanes teichomyceticus]